LFNTAGLGFLTGVAMKEQTREEPQILAAAERQMQAWVMNQEVEARSAGSQELGQLAGQVRPYIAISRESGAGGSEIAQAVGGKLAWEVLDKNLLDRVADRFRVSRMMLELVDETQSSWVYDVLGTWMDRQVVPHEKYVAHLGRIVLAAARKESHVFVGRGAQFLLPPDRGLAVRIIAPKKYRIERIMRREGLNAAGAGQFAKETDRGRREFVERFFHRDIDDPHLYDLVINVGHVGSAGAVDQIIAGVGAIAESA